MLNYETDSLHKISAALQLLAVARRHLSILELAWAVAISKADPTVRTIAEIEQLVYYEETKMIIQRIFPYLDLDDLRRRQVSLPHTAAGSIVIQAWNSDQEESDGPRRIVSPGKSIVLTSDSDMDIERKMLQLCMRYLLLDEVDSMVLLSQEQNAMEELPQEFELFSDEDDSNSYTVECTWEAWEEGMIRFDPAECGFGEFFAYASVYWISHLGAVMDEPLPDLEAVENICKAGSSRLMNWTAQNSRPDCALKPRFDFDGSMYDPLSVTSLYGSDALLLKMVQKAKFDQSCYLPRTAMLAAGQVLRWGDKSRLGVLFRGLHTGPQLHVLEFFRLLIDSWLSRNTADDDDWDSTFDLVTEITTVLVEEDWGADLLPLAVAQGCTSITQRLLTAARKDTRLKEKLFTSPVIMLRRLTNLAQTLPMHFYSD